MLPVGKAKGKFVPMNNTVMHRLTMGLRSEKCVVRRFHSCANVI